MLARNNNSFFTAGGKGDAPDEKETIVNLIKKNIELLVNSEEKDLLENIQLFLEFIEKNSDYSHIFYAEYFNPIWKKLISLHSNMLTNMSLAYGKQIYSSKLNPFQQLLGVYYLALALNTDKKIEAVEGYSSEKIALLTKAATSNSLQAALLARAYYIEQFIKNNENSNLNEFLNLVQTFPEIYLSPGCFLYGELLIQMSHSLYLAMTSRPTHMREARSIFDLFAKGVKYCFIGDLIKEHSLIEINNAYGVIDGNIPYGSGSVFYGEEVDDIHTYCRRMRSMYNFPVEMSQVICLAQEEAQKILNQLATSTENKNAEMVEDLSLLIKRFNFEERKGLTNSQ